MNLPNVEAAIGVRLSPGAETPAWMWGLERFEGALVVRVAAPREGRTPV